MGNWRIKYRKVVSARGRKVVSAEQIAGSSNGRIHDSESCHLGSNPSPAASTKRPHPCGGAFSYYDVGISWIRTEEWVGGDAISSHPCGRLLRTEGSEGATDEGATFELQSRSNLEIGSDSE